MKCFIVTCLMFLLSFNLSAEEKKSVADIVDDFYALKELNLMDKHPCRPNGNGCFRTACENVGAFECDEEEEMNTLRRACRGVWGDQCLVTSMRYLGKFEYDDVEEMSQLASSCRGVYDTECITYTCNRLGNFGCDDLEEIVSVNRTCAGY